MFLYCLKVTHSVSALPVLVLELVLATSTGSGSGTSTNIRNTAESSWLQLMLQLDTPNLRHGGYSLGTPNLRCVFVLCCVQCLWLLIICVFIVSNLPIQILRAPSVQQSRHPPTGHRDCPGTLNDITDQLIVMSFRCTPRTNSQGDL